MPCRVLKMLSETQALHFLETDVLVIGAGGAGMSAALAAAGQGCQVLLADRSLVGRGGATVMAQMTVAAAVGPEDEDNWRYHYADTLKAGRGLCNEPLARLLCEEGVEAIRLLDTWKVGWARAGGKLAQAHAPGHDRPRCVYVDFLNTGPAVAQTLRTKVAREKRVQRAGDLLIVELLKQGDAVVGALALHLASGAAVLISAGATIIATGGLTRLYRRNSASLNMGGDGFALALRAGAALVDMEFVQFFPIGHLAPRLVGFDPIMWDPFRYKLGGRLLNGLGEEFVEKYGNSAEHAKYTVTRDAATYAILKEVEAGRGTPHGGAWLSFTHVSEAELRAAFGPIIDKLQDNGIDLTKTMIEVAPIAHYHMGGIQVDTEMATAVPGLYAAGEAVGGANGANRLSGNAITEAVAFGLHAGKSAANWAAQSARRGENDLRKLAAPWLAELGGHHSSPQQDAPAALIAALQDAMQDYVGPFRTASGLSLGLERLAELRQRMGPVLAGSPGPQEPERIDALDLRNMLLVAETIALSALERRESRGAHQREDFPGLDEAFTFNQVVRLHDGRLNIVTQPVPRLEDTPASMTEAGSK